MVACVGVAAVLHAQGQNAAGRSSGPRSPAEIAAEQQAQRKLSDLERNAPPHQVAEILHELAVASGGRYVSDGIIYGRGAVTLPALVRGADLVVAGTGQEWIVKAIRMNGVDVTDTGVNLDRVSDVAKVEVELTARRPEVSGTVTGPRGEAIRGFVLLFPEDRNRWIVGSRLLVELNADGDGRFNVRTLPPGRYLGIAFDFISWGRIKEPEYLESLRSRATPFTLSAGETKTLNLTVQE